MQCTSPEHKEVANDIGWDFYQTPQKNVEEALSCQSWGTQGQEVVAKGDVEPVIKSSIMVHISCGHRVIFILHINIVTKPEQDL